MPMREVNRLDREKHVRFSIYCTVARTTFLVWWHVPHRRLRLADRNSSSCSSLALPALLLQFSRNYLAAQSSNGQRYRQKNIAHHTKSLNRGFRFLNRESRVFNLRNRELLVLIRNSFECSQGKKKAHPF